MSEPLDPTRLPNPVQEGDVPEAAQLDGTFREDKGGALLKVELPTLQPKIEFGGKTMVLKPEFHVTLVGFAAKLDKRFKDAAAARGEKVSNSLAAERVAAALKTAAEGLQFKVQMGTETRHAVKGEAETIIRMCDVEGMSEYFSRVAAALGLPEGSIEAPPTHVTVYTLENGQGIGIPNQEQLQALTTVLSEEELAELRAKTTVE